MKINSKVGSMKKLAVFLALCLIANIIFAQSEIRVDGSFTGVDRVKVVNTDTGRAVYEGSVRGLSESREIPSGKYEVRYTTENGYGTQYHSTERFSVRDGYETTIELRERPGGNLDTHTISPSRW